jgi:hypothetical protein
LLPYRWALCWYSGIGTMLLVWVVMRTLVGVRRVSNRCRVSSRCEDWGGFINRRISCVVLFLFPLLNSSFPTL